MIKLPQEQLLLILLLTTSVSVLLVLFLLRLRKSLLDSRISSLITKTKPSYIVLAMVTIAFLITFMLLRQLTAPIEKEFSLFLSNLNNCTKLEVSNTFPDYENRKFSSEVAMVNDKQVIKRVADIITDSTYRRRKLKYSFGTKDTLTFVIYRKEKKLDSCNIIGRYLIDAKGLYEYQSSNKDLLANIREALHLRGAYRKIIE